MPFTFSHPTAVLPLLALPRRWRSATGLFIGSITPDFEKFIRMSPVDPFSHTWRSIFYFNLPMGIFLAFLFHALVRDALLSHAPLFVRQRFICYQDLSWRNIVQQRSLVLIFSLLAGTVSHLAWDSFTHRDGRVVTWFPVLEKVLVPAQDNLYLFELLQTISSVLGAIVLLFYFLKLKKFPLPLTTSSAQLRWFWLSLALVWVLAFSAKVLVGSGREMYSINHAAITGISCGLLSALVVSAYAKYRAVS